MPAREPAEAYLVRHGVASPSSPTGDLGRALTEQGRRAFAGLVDRLLRKEALKVNRVLSSPALRARETAGLIAERMGLEVEECDLLAPGTSVGAELLALLVRYGRGTVLVGHNPEMGEALARAARQPQMVPPGTFAAVELDDSVRLRWLEIP